MESRMDGNTLVISLEGHLDSSRTGAAEQEIMEVISKHPGQPYCLDADKLTHEMLGEVPPNVAMLGALVKGTGCVKIESLLEAIRIKIPGKAGERNAEACRAAFERS